MEDRKHEQRLHLKGKRVDDKRIEVGGVIFYESSNSKAIKKYARTYKKRVKNV